LHALEGLMSDEKPWKAALRQSLEQAFVCADGCTGCTQAHFDSLMDAALPHMDSAYKVGRMKASARIGARVVQRNLELSRKLRQIREAVMNQSYSVSLDETLLALLGEDEGPGIAEQEVRAKALLEAADVVDNDDDCDCNGCDTCVPRQFAATLRRMAKGGV
jgi:hypothetical protein